jgi:hemolysin activation/secretion protein
VHEAPAAGVGSGLAITVREFEVVGSTVFSREELEALTRPATGRPLHTEDLRAVRDAITRHYVEHGYVTSGAVLPDQDVSDGIVTLQVEEGLLAEIELRGLKGFRETPLRRRLARAGRAPVNVHALERELQRLQQNPRVARVNASLAPTERRGESRLVVDVEEASRISALARFSNDQPPSIGELTGEAGFEVGNLIGWDDVSHVRLEISEGLREVQAAYDVAVTPWETRLGIDYQQSHADVVEDQFSQLDIESRSLTAGVSLVQPLFWTPRRQIDVGIFAEYREGSSSVVGTDICLQQNAFDCTPSLAVLRFRGDALWRGEADVVGLRSTLSWGIDALGATTAGSGSIADGRFVAWLGQAQWVHLLPESLLSTQLVTRLDVQIASEALLSLEQIAIGGFDSVRGYRENQFVRDNGVIASAELRIPVWREPFGRPRLELVPFSDVGRAWNASGPRREETPVSVGIGLRASPWRWLSAALFWGARLSDAERSQDGLQRHGLHFALEARYPGR